MAKYTIKTSELVYANYYYTITADSDEEALNKQMHGEYDHCEFGEVYDWANTHDAEIIDVEE